MLERTALVYSSRVYAVLVAPRCYILPADSRLNLKHTHVSNGA
jgi:hypothetical protein